MRFKVTVVGAGNVGATIAQLIAAKGYADVALVDVIEGLPQGKALDILQCGPITGSDAKTTGSNGYEITRGSDIAIITSGVARRPGMSRDDLVLTNMNIVRSVVERVIRHSPNCIIVLVTNPVDAMTQLALNVSRYPRTRVFGQSGVLDSARFATFIAEELKVSVTSVQACVLGGHGDTMVPVPRLTTVAGVPLTGLLDRETINRLVDRTIKGGGEIVSLLKTGSAYYAPAAATVRMVEAVLFDKMELLPCAAYLEGEYGISGTVVGIPCRLGSRGIEQFVELKLTEDELAALRKSAGSVRELARLMKLE